MSQLALFDDVIEQKPPNDCVFSPCRQYRYRLTHTWDESLPAGIVIGVNPSTADEQALDPTLKRVVSLLTNEGCGSLVMLNLFAFRATDPQEMLKHQDPIGDENDAQFAAAIADQEEPLVVAAWGNHGSHLSRDREVLALLRMWGVKPKCWGLNQGGSPKHPLYLSGSCRLRSYQQ